MTNSESTTYETDSGVEYTPHSMMHKAVVRMEPTKLEMLDGFERTDAGHKYSPQDSNVRVIITGRDWSEESFLIYGSKSSKEAEQHIEAVLDRITDIGHNARLVDGPEITNIAVNGDFETSFQLEDLSIKLSERGIDVEYEPEQFPGTIIQLNDISATFLIFSTGKFIIQGLSSLEDIEPVINRIQELI
jgi:hypothetical protein